MSAVPTDARKTRAAPILSPNTRRVAWTVSIVFFIEQLDATILAPALPAMAHELGTHPITLSAAITAYMLGLAVMIPMSGKLAERFGDKLLFSIAVTAFLASSVACGLAPNAEVLIALRFVQGLAGALMAPVGRLIVLRAAPTHEMIEAMALVIQLAMIAPMFGPALGGLLTTTVGWRWIFWINVPLCLLALGLVWRFLPSTAGNRGTSFDILGAGLTGLGFAGVVYGLVELGERHGPAAAGALPVWLTLGGGVLLALYTVHARRHASPVLALALLQLRSFRAAMSSGSVFRIAVGGIPFLLPLTLQQAYGYNPLAAGLVVLLPACGGFAMKFFSTRLLRRLGYRHGLALHGLLAAGCLALVGVLHPRDALIVYVLTIFGFGWARSLQMNAFGTLAYADVEKPSLPAATSFFLAIQNLTTALGVALAAVVLRVLAQLPGMTLQDSHRWTYVLLSVLALVSAVMCWAIPASAGGSLLATRKS